MYRVHMENGKFVEEEKVTGPQMLDEKYVLDDPRREKLLEGIMSNSPFRVEKIPSRDSSLLRSRDFGRNFYVRLNARRLAAQPPGKVVAEIPILGGGKSVYRVKSNEYYPDEPYLMEDRYDLAGVNKGGGSVDDRMLSLWIASGSLNSYKGRPNTDQYIENIKNEIVRMEREFPDRDVSFLTDQVGFHMHGFAEQAGILGDVDGNTKVAATASTLVPKGLYDEIVAQRVGPNGEFRLTLTDLQKMSTLPQTIE